MTSDDLIAHLASLPKKNRPTELRSDAKMLQAWLFCRKMLEFDRDVIRRHCLDLIPVYRLDEDTSSRDHAIGNAWGWLVQSILK